MLSELEFGEALHIGAILFAHCAFHGKKVRSRRERQGRLAVGRLARCKLAEASARRGLLESVANVKMQTSRVLAIS